MKEKKQLPLNSRTKQKPGYFKVLSVPTQHLPTNFRSFSVKPKQGQKRLNIHSSTDPERRKIKRHKGTLSDRQHFQLNMSVTHRENVRVKLDTTLEKYSLENNIGVISLWEGKRRLKHSVTSMPLLLFFFMSFVILYCKNPLQIKSSLPKRPSNLAGQTKSFLFNNCTFIPPLFFFRMRVLWGCFLFR